MGGGLMQLVSYGAQDIYISGNPQITFWKVLYKRHTNFAVESIEVTFNGQADFNKRVTAIINRNADLMYKTYIQVVLPQIDLTATSGTFGSSVSAPTAGFRWLNYIGHRLIKQVEIEIGGQRIDRQYGDWMQIWTQLSTEAGLIRALESVVGNTHDLVLMKRATGIALDATCTSSETTISCVPRKGTPAKTLYIPLQFWFCRNPGLAIPLIALQYHEVRINVDFETWQNCQYTETSIGTPVQPTAQSLAAASLYVDYVYLDTEERRRFAQQSHEYLIEQVQYTGAESITSSSNKIQLNFNHPVKELQWVVQRDSFVDCSAPLWVASVGGPQPFNYSDDFSTDGLIVSLLSQAQQNATGAALTSGQGNQATALLGQGVTEGTSIIGVDTFDLTGSAEFESGVNYLLAKVILDSGIRCEGKNPVEVAKLQLNGQDRFTEREGSYFDKVQPLQHHTRTPSTGINVYSFALRPEEHQPSGTCNFSRIDKATLQLTVSINTVTGSRTAQVRVYALNYNVLRVMSGMGGLAYSN
jgi:Large eukaryotic DNA virus major capsid protein/Major capsid protein N-terminus